MNINTTTNKRTPASMYPIITWSRGASGGIIPKGTVEVGDTVGVDVEVGVIMGISTSIEIGWINGWLSVKLFSAS